MGYSVKTYRCIDCGKTVTRRRDPRQPMACAECAIKRAGDALRQLHNKSGPVYERMLRGMRASADRRLALAGLERVAGFPNPFDDKAPVRPLSPATRRDVQKRAAGWDDRMPRRSRAEANRARARRPPAGAA